MCHRLTLFAPSFSWDVMFCSHTSISNLVRRFETYLWIVGDNIILFSFLFVLMGTSDTICLQACVGSFPEFM
jgi:hypothetical protein